MTLGCPRNTLAVVTHCARIARTSVFLQICHMEPHQTLGRGCYCNQCWRRYKTTENRARYKVKQEAQLQKAKHEDDNPSRKGVHHTNLCGSSWCWAWFQRKTSCWLRMLGWITWYWAHLIWAWMVLDGIERDLHYQMVLAGTGWSDILPTADYLLPTTH